MGSPVICVICTILRRDASDQRSASGHRACGWLAQVHGSAHIGHGESTGPHLAPAECVNQNGLRVTACLSIVFTLTLSSIGLNPFSKIDGALREQLEEHHAGRV